MFIFGIAIALAGDLPDVLAGGRVDGNDPGTAGVDELQVEAFALQKRRGVHAELDLEGAVALLSVEPPNLLAVEIESREVAGSDEGVDVFAVGAGGWRSVVALVATDLAAAGAAGELAFPQLLAVGADAQEHEIAAVLAAEEDAVSPDDR